ncbi:hypothetical protein [Paenibacillus sp. NPDC057967]|uniref:hypothetical protein n=1 Tax=Paenibacillus sp. NPDC057967 TaxID=3346293 RepID=UPI0036DB2C65
MIGSIYEYTRKHPVDETIEGVNYQLGAENSGNVQAETVRIKGHWSRSLKGIRTFKGTFEFANRDIPVPEESREVIVRFSKEGYGPVVYQYLDDTNKWEVRTKFFNDGIMFANSDFSSVVFMIPSEDKVESESISNGRYWSGENGLMFAGPATTREQALAISNALTEKHFTRHGFVNKRFILE